MDAYLGEVRPFAGHSEPAGWAYCDGRKLKISEHEPLFSLIGNVYGGDGVNDFALPNLAGRVPIGAGHRPGGSAHALGARGGDDTVALQTSHIPAHIHRLQATTLDATDNLPSTERLLAKTVPEVHAYNDLTQPGSGNAMFAAAAIGSTGAGAAHANVMPSLVITYIICLNGLYPQPG